MRFSRTNALDHNRLPSLDEWKSQKIQQDYSHALTTLCLRATRWRDIFVQRLLYAYNSHVHQITGAAPFILVLWGLPAGATTVDFPSTISSDYSATSHSAYRVTNFCRDWISWESRSTADWRGRKRDTSTIGTKAYAKHGFSKWASHYFSTGYHPGSIGIVS